METKYTLGIQSQWYNNEKTLICTEIGEPWTWEDVEEDLARILEMAQSFSHSLGLMLIIPNDLSIPPTGFTQSMRQVMKVHAEAGFHTVIYVIASPALQTLWEESITTFASDVSRYHIADTLEEALEIFASRSE
jgi:hypothetical protein